MVVVGGGDGDSPLHPLHVVGGLVLDMAGYAIYRAAHSFLPWYYAALILIGVILCICILLIIIECFIRLCIRVFKKNNQNL